MRIFDAIGIATVAVWLGIISITAWNTFHKPPVAQAKSDQIVLTEGESWMVLRKSDEDIGYIHESRIQIDDGWLLEYKTMISVSMLGTDQTFQSSLKATVDEHAYIRDFTNELTVMDKTFETKGKMVADALQITTYSGKSETTKTLHPPSPPRLLTTAFNKTLAKKDLENGEKIDDAFFDPASMEMIDITIHYIEPSQTEVWDEVYDSHKFTIYNAGTRRNVITSTDGAILLQELPMDILASRVPPAIGRATAMTLRTNIQKRKKERKKNPSKPVDIGLDTALKIAKKITGNDSEQKQPHTPGHYTISDIPDQLKLGLDSNRQYITAKTADAISIDTNPDNAFQNAFKTAFTTPESLQPFLETSARIDGSAENIQKLLKNADLNPEDTKDHTENAHKIAAAIAKAMKPEPNIAVLSASQALDLGRGDCTEYALITVAALRQANIPARFVHGLIYDDNDGKTLPHQWVQYFDGKRFIDLDATRKDGKVSLQHIQLFTSDTPEHPNYLEALNTISVQPSFP